MEHERKPQLSNRSKIQNKNSPHQDNDIPQTTSGVPNSIISLQQLIGNKAVQRFLASKPINVAQSVRQPTIQLKRQPYGLETTSSVDRYTDYALKLHADKPKMSLREFADELTKNVSQELTKNGVPQVKITLKPHGTDGEFKQDSWELIVDPSKFNTQKTQVNELGLLSREDVINATGTIYHEARHADQDFLVARMLAGKKKTAEQINKETGMPVEVTQKAVDNKLSKTKANAEQIAEAETLFDVMYGEHKELLGLVIKHGAKIKSVGENLSQMTELDDGGKTVDSALLNSTITDTHALINDLDKWSNTVSQAEISRLQKKAKKSPLDTQMLNDLTDINKEIAKISKEWKANPKPDLGNVLDFGEVFPEFFKVFGAAYKRIPSEKDAFNVEAIAKKRMGSRLKAKSKDKSK
jgi:hypothetical protein